MKNKQSSKIRRAKLFAYAAHTAVGQKRKYTNENYFVHPEEVVKILTENSFNKVSKNQICAAYLHDVVEDTSITLDDINEFFGYKVKNLVYWLTDISKRCDGNREARKCIDRDHIAKAPVSAKSIKLADLISNTSTIVQYDKGFAKVYLEEKRLLLEVLKDADKNLLAYAHKILDESLQLID